MLSDIELLESRIKSIDDEQKCRFRGECIEFGFVFCAIALEFFDERLSFLWRSDGISDGLHGIFDIAHAGHR